YKPSKTRKGRIDKKKGKTHNNHDAIVHTPPSLARYLGQATQRPLWFEPIYQVRLSIYEIRFCLSRPAKPTPPPPSDKQMKSLFGPSVTTNLTSSNTNPLRRLFGLH
ncbi:unnamed protein product, partial [Ectocarpus sp. 8 AP-2014]